VKSLVAPSKIERRLYPCPNCQAPTSVGVLTSIESEEDLLNFISLRLNRAQCSFCHCQVEALVRAVVRMSGATSLDQECIPAKLLESPEAVSELARKLDEGAVISFSHEELERSIEARIRVAFHREGMVALESGEVVPISAPNMHS